MNLKNKSDKKLLELYNSSKNECYFKEIVQRYYSKLYNISYTILKNSHDAQDVVQIVFFKLFKQSKKCKDNNVGGWLYKITRNASVDIIRIYVRKRNKENSFFIEKNDIIKNSYREIENKNEKERKLDLVNYPDTKDVGA